MTRHFLFASALLFLTACSSQTEEKRYPEIFVPDSPSTVRLVPDSPWTGSYHADPIANKTTQTDTLITDRFLKFIKYLDSSGYSWDTIRFRKVTIYPRISSKPKFIDNFAFYQVPFNHTTLFSEHKIIALQTPSAVKFAQGDKYAWDIDTNEYKKVKKIIAYYFRQTNPPSKDWVIDGMVEEWEFPDTTIARQLSEDLGKKQIRLFFNRGAFVCYADNYMYVFHSRASGFMYPIKPFFKNFTTDSKVKNTTQLKWY